MCHPVKYAVIYYASAYSCAVTVHILGCRMCNYICTELKGSAVNGCSEGIVYDKRYSVSMRSIGKFLDIKHCKRRIGYSLSENSLGVGLEGCIQLLFAAVRVYKGKIYAHPLHGYGEKIVGSAVDRA